MSKNVLKSWTRWIEGIADYQDEGSTSQFYMGRNLDVRSNPRAFTLNPRTIKESGSNVLDLIKWGDVYASNGNAYFYGDAGHIYRRTSSRVYTDLRTVANSHGNGLIYNPEDNYIYYTGDKVIGRYGNLADTSPTFSDDFLGAQGGIPLNTASLDLESGSSQYVTAADSAPLSITGDITLEGYFKPESLPAAAAQMALISKWNGSSDERSFKFDLAAVAAVFGDGAEGALTISSNTIQAPTDSACTGTAASYSLTATNASFATGQKILIHQTQGTNAGQWERNEIASYTAGTITLANSLVNTYTSGAQVIALAEYTNVTINSTKTWTVKAWNGTVGGILAFLSNGTVTITGNISANGGDGSIGVGTPSGGSGGGFRGGSGQSSSGSSNQAVQGEGYSGTGSSTYAANANGGGGGYESGAHSAGGGGGGNGTAGATGTTGSGQYPGIGGSTSGSADLNTMVFGGGGGGGAVVNANSCGGGGSGGGIIFITAATVAEITGSITANGGSGGYANSDATESGGNGAGGSILIKTQVATLGTGKITANGGSQAYVAAGGVGRIHLDYYTSYTGTTSPTLDATEDSTLATSTVYQLRLSVSHTDGTSGNSETLAKELPSDPVLSTWYHWAVAWDASESEAEFFVNGSSIGTATGAVTSIYNSTALFSVGASFSDAGSAEKFFDGKVDEIRVWNDLRTESELNQYKETEIQGASANLQGYWQVDSLPDDSTSNANNLTLVGSPSYDTADVPFSSPTTRQDLDQSLDTSGNTYALTAAINEAATHRQTFTPAKDPQKSIQVLVSDTGDDGDWTLTVHDIQNRLIASKTITHASMAVGDVEFTFATPWRPLTNFTNVYHFHLTVSSTTGAPAVTTTDASDLETVDFHTYYQFLVEDTAWHPLSRFLNFIVVGNERYVGKYEATLYDPHRLTLPAEWKVRCFGYWLEYLAIGVFKGSNIYDFDYGRVYFWDGSNPDRPNFWIDVPEGGINALWGTKGKLYIWAGYKGDILVYEGGASARKLRRTPLSIDTERIETYPQAVGMWNALIRYGISAGNSTVVNRAVYSYGSTNEQKYPDSLTCDYTVSTGNYLSTIGTGMIFPYNQELLVSWKDGSGYGVDYINNSNNPFPTGTMEMLTEDYGVPFKEKEALSLVVNFDELASGEDIDLYYQNNETDTNWNSDSESPSAGDTVYRRQISNGRNNEMRIKLDLIASGANAPSVKSVLLVSDPLSGEEVYG